MFVLFFFFKKKHNFFFLGYVREIENFFVCMWCICGIKLKKWKGKETLEERWSMAPSDISCDVDEDSLDMPDADDHPITTNSTNANCNGELSTEYTGTTTTTTTTATTKSNKNTESSSSSSSLSISSNGPTYCVNNNSSPLSTVRNRKPSRLHCVKGDTTNSQDNLELVKYVETVCLEDNLRMWGLINNAGVLRVGEIEMLELKDFIDVINVNVIGSIDVSKRFLHLLRQTKHSRVINICSASSMAPMYGWGTYAISYSAMEAFSTVLRAEMSAIWKVHVSCILCGAFSTPLLDSEKNFQFYMSRVKQLKKQILEDYSMEYFTESASKCVLGTKYEAGKDIAPVINAVLDAMLRRSPYKR
ncbi:hypothetical protein RFI_08012 [Reticulomyxa filosa]|uniref:Uncharacterized protein n=1 Tax=Reticulomyxa filosa TaxID=46433 RepID=X6NS56_RETFI|nr:hypothetical protein RFI_08012 [Reticulomyxa filosa]|eukprot:ETO29115.1 hypothetical protein RFI_08012 [Reticulomyxa filosa]